MISNYTLITTGGTIDAEPFDEENYPKFSTLKNSKRAYEALKAILYEHAPQSKLKLLRLIDKDSKDINDNDLNVLFETLTEVKAQRIIITCGTDRMTSIACNIKKYLMIIILPYLVPLYSRAQCGLYHMARINQMVLRTSIMQPCTIKTYRMIFTLQAVTFLCSLIL